MSNIKDILNDCNSVLVFDIDGVLAKMEFGLYNHFLEDDKWSKINIDNNPYDEKLVVHKFQDFISSKNKNNIFVNSKVYNEKEMLCKKSFVLKYYNVQEDNVLFVYDDKDKLENLNQIKNRFPSLDDRHIVMIDDSVNVLNYVMDNSNYSTAHTSSFID